MGREHDGGFTLTELLIVLGIVAVLSAIAIPNLLSAKRATNETGAIATLRTVAAAQALVQGTARIDVDADSVGEFATFVELVGEAGVRTRLVAGSGSRDPGADFNTQGPPLDPPGMTPATIEFMENSGHLVKAGYAFMIFLPDANDDGVAWVHEEIRLVVRGRGRGRRTVEQVRLRNPTSSPNRIGVDLSESLWCAYGHPVGLGRTGSRVFFMSQQGDLLHSSNEVAKHQGQATVIPPQSAYTGSGITSAPAVGTRGNDGDTWKVTN
jgi:prepilin-type N-terminal cleavage/methylation domain-containing protein